jgi:RNA polymerase sigma factor for flagellar operon FliA
MATSVAQRTDRNVNAPAGKAEELFLSSLGLIDRIASFICRRNHLSTADAEDFIANVRLKIIEDDYAVLRKFEHRSSIQTYLTVVIQRLFLEQRVQMWGKWRPSAEAKRLGDKAITLERLMSRDGYSFREAVQILTTGERPEYSMRELEAMYARLPARSPRPVLVSEVAAAEAVPDGRSADEDLLQHEQDVAMRTTAKTLDCAIAKMDPEDQLILRMRFWSDRRVADIAAALGLDPKKTYKRIDRLLAGLRAELGEKSEAGQSHLQGAR